MSDSTPSADSGEVFLARLMQELEGADDREAVMRRFCEERPEMAEEIRELAGMNRVMDDSPGGWPAVPERLGEFRIVRRLSRGGMGEIYEAEQEPLQGRRVALKVIRRGRVSAGARERFLREQEVLARLHQTHIVPVHTAGEQGGIQYLVMPYIDGAALHHVVWAAYQESLRAEGSTPSLRDLATRVAADSKVGEAQEQGKAPDGHQRTGSYRPAPEAGPVPREAKVRLSMDYYRSVAQVMAEAAEAVQHAHEAGVLHRDLKPSNVMVDRAGQCWLIDFGLAGYLKKGPEGTDPVTVAEVVPGPGTASGVMGTIQYMSPEQVKGKSNRQSDVYGLGATLYELLTLRRPFDGETAQEVFEQVETQEPAPPGTLVANLPPDLGAICLKAMSKEPADRYGSAGAVAEDLGRWLRYEPTRARPARPLRRSLLWARRNPGWAAALGFLAVSVAAIAGGLIYGAKAEAARAGDRAEASERERKAQVASAIARAAAAERERKIIAEKEQEQRRQVLIQELERIKLTSHEHKWFPNAWAKVRAAGQIRTDGELRDLAASLLGGMDAKKFKEIPGGATSVAVDGKGRMVMGGLDAERGLLATGARLWDNESDELRTSSLKGPGPVAFAPDGTALQLVARSPWSYLLWDVKGDKLVRELRIPDGKKPDAGENWPAPTMTMTSDGAFVAASPGVAGKKGLLAVWDGRTGKLLGAFGAMPASALALSPDGKLLATGDEEGKITAWSVPDAKELTTLKVERAVILALAFGRDVRKRHPEEGDIKEGAGWLLAAGDAGGTVTVWDVARKQPRSFCRGSPYGVHSVAFSPDGVTLASCGRLQAFLWDLATGRPLLTIRVGNTLPACAFTPDGQRLAVASLPVFDSQPRVTVWDLEFGHGLRSFRGLAGITGQVVFSPDGERLAALSHNWQVGLWEVKTGRLFHILDVPKGYHVDNAGLAFSPDGQRFAFSSGTRATMWNVESGEEMRSWVLPPGLQDRLLFRPDGELLLFRFEKLGGKAPPPAEQPWVCLVRNLLAPDSLKPISEVTAFNLQIESIRVTPDGALFLVIGRHGERGDTTASARAFETLTGKELWRRLLERSLGEFKVDPTGRLAAMPHPWEDARDVLVDVATGRIEGAVKGVLALSPEGRQMAINWRDQRWEIVRRRDDRVLVRFRTGGHAIGFFPQFSPKGEWFVWASQDGSTWVADLEEVRQRLTEVDMGW